MSAKCKEGTRERSFGKFKQFLATLCLGPITIGSSIGWTSPVLPYLENLNTTSPFHLTTEEGSWVGSMLAIGALCSAIPAGYLADLIGSKKCIIGFALLMVIFTMMVVFANGVIILCIGRVFSGIAVGGISAVSPLYISEISDVSLRGTLGSFFELAIYSGIVLTAICGAYLHYLTLTIILGVFAFVLAVIFLFLPESPTYLMKINKREEAEIALRFYKCQEYDCTADLDQIQEGFVSRSKEKKNIGEILKSKGAIRGLVACVGLTAFQQLSGIDGIVFYTVQIFQAAGTPVDAYTSSIIVSLVELLSAGVVVFIIEKFNRKLFLYVSAIGTCLCLGLFGLYFNLKEFNVDFVGMGFLPLTSLIVYNIAFAMGLGPIPWMINGELFPPEIKGLANGITIATNWILLFVITKMLPIMIRDFGPHYTFYTFSGFMVLCAVFVKLYVPETRGKTLEQIQEELKK